MDGYPGQAMSNPRERLRQRQTTRHLGKYFIKNRYSASITQIISIYTFFLSLNREYNQRNDRWCGPTIGASSPSAIVRNDHGKRKGLCHRYNSLIGSHTIWRCPSSDIIPGKVRSGVASLIAELASFGSGLYISWSYKYHEVLWASIQNSNDSFFEL